jgi:hypothetical protein
MGALDVLAGMVVLALALWSAARALSWWCLAMKSGPPRSPPQAQRLGLDFVATDALHVSRPRHRSRRGSEGRGAMEIRFESEASTGVCLSSPRR